jgi:tRNA G18 (ribose-2'-O)-methylase SpoU
VAAHRLFVIEGRLVVAGLSVLAMSPSSDAVAIDAIAASGHLVGRIALLLGAEGVGLSAETQALADVRLRIPIAPHADSLNVAVAAAIGLHTLRPPSSPR